MLKALIKTRFAALLSQITSNKKIKSKSSPANKIVFAVVFVYVIGCFSYMFYTFASQLCPAFISAHISWFFFTVISIIAFSMMFIASIFTTQTQLFDAKDNELLLSMPLPPKYILLSRMIMLYALNLFFELLVVIPAEIVFIQNTGFNILSFLCFVIIILVLPFFALAFSALFGFFIAKISSFIRNKSAATTICSIIFLVVYFYFFSQLNSIINKLIASGQVFAGNIKGVAAPLYWMGSSIADANLLFLTFAVITLLIPFIIVYYVLDKTFIGITTTKRGFKKIEYKEEDMTVSSAKKALFKREFSRFLSNPIYIINASLGCIISAILGIVLIFKKSIITDLFVEVPELATLIIPIMIFAICAVCATNIISAPSISLEGKTLWVIKSMPIKTNEVLLSKILVHFVVCAPFTLFLSIVCAIQMPSSIILKICMIVIPQLFNLLISLIGVLVNLAYPKFDWLSETQAIKQSLSPICTMLLAFVAILIPGGCFMSLTSSTFNNEAFFILFAVIYALICVVLYRRVMTKGVKQFDEF